LVLFEVEVYRIMRISSARVKQFPFDENFQPAARQRSHGAGDQTQRLPLEAARLLLLPEQLDPLGVTGLWQAGATSKSGDLTIKTIECRRRRTSSASRRYDRLNRLDPRADSSGREIISGCSDGGSV
jgi:hypothetical protein